MLRSLNDVKGYSLHAQDGKIGSVDDFYFDDVQWRVRYLVVDTGNWLPGRRVLISPVALGQPAWESGTLPVDLTEKQVKNSPSIDEHKPVSRQYELELQRYYGWPVYWHTVAPVGVDPPVESAETKGAQSGDQPKQAGEECCLRSSGEVTGYRIQATDGEIGHVEDFITDDEKWVLRYMVVDTRNWLPGKKVLVAPSWIEKVKWKGAEVHVDVPRKAVKESPEYDPTAPVNTEYEARLYDFYGRPKYWLANDRAEHREQPH